MNEYQTPRTCADDTCGKKATRTISRRMPEFGNLSTKIDDYCFNCAKIHLDFTRKKYPRSIITMSRIHARTVTPIIK